MNKFLFLLSLMLPFFSWSDSFDLKARLGYQYPTSREFREIYGSGNLAYGLEVSSPICSNIGAFLGVDYFTAKGDSTVDDYHTRITTLQTSLGVTYSWPIKDCLSIQGGIGAIYTPVIMTDDSPFVPHHRNRGGYGFLLRLGTQFFLNEDFSLELFGDYSWQEFSYNHSYQPFVQGRYVDLSHLKLGGGLSYRF